MNQDAMQAPTIPRLETRSPARFNVAAYLRLQSQLQASSMAIAVANGPSTFQELSYAQLEARSNEQATALLAAGVARGMRTIMMVPISPDFYSLTFAMFKIGAVPVFLDPAMGTKMLKTCMSSVEPTAFVGVPKAHFARVLMRWKPTSLRHTIRVGEGIGPGTPLVRPGQKLSSELLQIAPVESDELAAILFTSGSTGTPKGVEYTHGMFRAQLDLIRQGFGVQPGERDLSTFPLFALFGPALGMASVVPHMDMRCPGQTEPQNLMQAIARYECTSSFLSPALVDRLATACQQGSSEQLQSLRRVISAGAPSRPAALSRLIQHLGPDAKIITPYGMTEAMPLTHIDHEDLLPLLEQAQAQREQTSFERVSAKHPGGVCVGKPLAGIHIDIIDIDERPLDRWAKVGDKAAEVQDYTQPCGAARRLLRGEIGEIVVRGSVVSPRYWARPVASQASKIGPCEPGVAHRTGDLGYMDQEGRLWLCGRRTQRVESGTQRYLTLPCEAVFNRVQGVLRSALVGVGPFGRSRPVVCVEVAPNTDRQALRVALAARAQELPFTRGIVDFFIHPGFPMDLRHNAKINREELAAWAAKKLRS